MQPIGTDSGRGHPKIIPVEFGQIHISGSGEVVGSFT